MDTQSAPAPDFATVPDVARRLGVCGASIRRAIERGELRAVRLGRSIRIPKSEMERVLRGE